jgi:hypothetical protein
LRAPAERLSDDLRRGENRLMAGWHGSLAANAQSMPEQSQIKEIDS